MHECDLSSPGPERVSLFIFVQHTRARSALLPVVRYHKVILGMYLPLRHRDIEECAAPRVLLLRLSDVSTPQLFVVRTPLSSQTCYIQHVWYTPQQRRSETIFTIFTRCPWKVLTMYLPMPCFASLLPW